MAKWATLLSLARIASHFASPSLPSLPPSPFDDEVHHHKKEINRDSDRDGSGRGDDKPPPSLRPSLFASLYWARLKNISQVV